jgi:hypothetical protein
MTTHLLKSVLINTVIFASQTALAEVTLPVVNVTATWGGEWNGWGDGRHGGVGIPFTGYPQVITMIAQLKQGQSVRCGAAGSLRNVTSQSDPLDRWQAAEQVYRSLVQIRSLWSRYVSGGTYLTQGTTFTVVFADGGSETYVIVNPTLSMVTSGQGQPGSLDQKDGVVRPDPVCG